MIDIIWNDSVKRDERIEELLELTASTALRLNNGHGDICLMVTDEKEIRQLNRDFRSIDKVTDVLSFPAISDDDRSFLGDIAICLSRAQEQADTYGHGIEREMAFLTAHGCLHLMGFDHIEPEDEKVMRAHQKEIMREMGLEIHE